MTQVVIPQPAGQVAPLGWVRLSVRLVTADGNQVVGFAAGGLLTEYADLDMTAERILDLVPQASIALPDGAATWYAINLQTRTHTEHWLVQVPDSPTPLTLAELVAATAIPPGDLLAETILPRLLPDPSLLPDGTLLSVSNGAWVTELGFPT
jgi:hypothetical protein